MFVFMQNRIIVRSILAVLLLGVAGFTGNHVIAQEDRFTITVTPPLFQLNLSPGETWTSGIQVVNSNPYDITVFAEPVLFTPADEEGRPSFYLPETDKGAEVQGAGTLAGWITVPQTAIAITREQTRTVPIAITVPEDAAPGGHYAAILVGNRAPDGVREGGSVSVTSSIAALVFLRVAGTVIEDGRIRDFATEKILYEKPEARLSLRFENQGNVHLQPQGDITIYNMFGKKRGYIPINQVQNYGNVLPGSIRKFSFVWKADPGNWDIGRYRAEVTLGYGTESKQFEQASTVFYVLPLVPVMQVVGGILAVLIFLGWALRAYVRRALAIEGVRLATEHEVQQTESKKNLADEEVQHKPRLGLETLVRPIQAGIVDLRNVGSSANKQSVSTDEAVLVSMHRQQQRTGTAVVFLREYRFFFVFIVVVALGWLAASAFFADVLSIDRSYTVIEERADGSRVDLSSDHVPAAPSSGP